MDVLVFSQMTARVGLVAYCLEIKLTSRPTVHVMCLDIELILRLTVQDTLCQMYPARGYGDAAAACVTILMAHAFKGGRVLRRPCLCSLRNSVLMRNFTPSRGQPARTGCPPPSLEPHCRRSSSQRRPRSRRRFRWRGCSTHQSGPPHRSTQR